MLEALHRHPVDGPREGGEELLARALAPNDLATIRSPRSLVESLEELIGVRDCGIRCLPENMHVQDALLHVRQKLSEARVTVQRPIFAEEEDAQHLHSPARRLVRLRRETRPLLVHNLQGVRILGLHCQHPSRICQRLLPLSSLIVCDHAPHERLDVGGLMFQHVRGVLYHRRVVPQLHIARRSVVGASYKHVPALLDEIQGSGVAANGLLPFLRLVGLAA
mmetsp:Transcript_52815/g.113098  ORF Transcript_52815/g.113098 Transcript_52815/m.113098 type:complete len:221 (+) Transcript_52815:2108-2770(+)